jgi:hypothetical protein
MNYRENSIISLPLYNVEKVEENINHYLIGSQKMHCPVDILFGGPNNIVFRSKAISHIPKSGPGRIEPHASPRYNK